MAISAWRRIAILCGFTLLTGGCGSHDSDSPPSSTTTTPPPPVNSISTAIAEGEVTGQLPVLNRDESIAGTDADNNGARDDIDNYIASLDDTSEQKAALTQDAKALQSSLTVDTTDTTALNGVAKQIGNSVTCLYSVYEPDSASQKGKDIQKLTVNTKARLDAYEKFNSALSGSTLKLPSGGGCEQ